MDVAATKQWQLKAMEVAAADAVYANNFAPGSGGGAHNTVDVSNSGVGRGFGGR